MSGSVAGDELPPLTPCLTWMKETVPLTTPGLGEAAMHADYGSCGSPLVLDY